MTAAPSQPWHTSQRKTAINLFRTHTETRVAPRFCARRMGKKYADLM